jgi:hypothetical protein
MYLETYLLTLGLCLDHGLLAVLQNQIAALDELDDEEAVHVVDVRVQSFGELEAGVEGAALEGIVDSLVIIQYICHNTKHPCLCFYRHDYYGKEGFTCLHEGHEV